MNILRVHFLVNKSDQCVRLMVMVTTLLWKGNCDSRYWPSRKCAGDTEGQFGQLYWTIILLKIWREQSLLKKRFQIFGKWTISYGQWTPSFESPMNGFPRFETLFSYQGH